MMKETMRRMERASLKRRSDLQRADGAVTPQETQVFEDEVPKRE